MRLLKHSLGILVGLSVFSLTPIYHSDAQQRATVRIDGSSTVYPLTEAAAFEYQKSSGHQVTVGISGTGGGFKKFCDGQTDVQNASRPISKEEMAKCSAKGIKYFELPMAYDAIVIVVNPRNTWLKSITVDELKRMWEPDAKDKIKTWKDVNPAWPNEPFKLFGAGTDSGTFDYFTEAIMGKAKASRPDYTASEDDNTLVQGVTGDRNAIGYFGFAYYEANRSKLRAVPVDGGAKAPKKGPIEPSFANIKAADYFPLSRPVFIYANLESMKRPEVSGFINFYVKNGTSLAQKAKLVPLPARAYEMSASHIKGNKVGTVFKGENKVGIKVEELLKLETTL